MPSRQNEDAGTALGLRPDDLRAIDTVRARLALLTSSVQRLYGDVTMSHPLPPPDSVQASASVLQKNMASVNVVLEQHADLFRRIVVHPDPSFPGRTEEQVLTSLLRKKLEPDVEAQAARARAAAAARGISVASFPSVQRTPTYEDDDDSVDEGDEENEDNEAFDGLRQPFGLGDVWYEARVHCIDDIGRFIYKESMHNYTKAEREQGIETVRTGLRRNIDDEEEEEEEEEDEDNDDDENDVDVQMVDTQVAETAHAESTTPAMPPVEPELLLWFAARGDANLPPYVEIETQRAAAAAASQRR